MALSLTAALAAHAEPLRIVSLNPCVDVMLVQVADRGQIAALSHWSRNPHGSTIAEVARTLPFTYGSAEEVAAIRPDLVLVGRPAPPAILGALHRLGIPTAAFSTPFSVAESAAQVRTLARLVGRPQRGEALVRRIRVAVAAAAPPLGRAPIPALVLAPGGSTYGPHTLTGEMLRRTGFSNVAERYGARDWGQVSLERLVADPPRVLLTGRVRPGASTWSERITSHPALVSMKGRMAVADLPERLLFCGGPVLIQTAEALARARRAVERP